MSFLVDLIYWEVVLFELALMVIVFSGLLTGRINTRGLLCGTKGDGKTYFSPERVQLLLVTLGSAFQYVLRVSKDPTHFPAVDSGWLTLFGGSHLVYLAGKLGASLIGRRSSLL